MSAIQRRPPAPSPSSPPLPTVMQSSTSINPLKSTGRAFSTSIPRLPKRRSITIIIFPILFIAAIFCLIFFRNILHPSTSSNHLSSHITSNSATIPPIFTANQLPHLSSNPASSSSFPRSIAILASPNINSNQILTTINSVQIVFPHLPITIFTPQFFHITNIPTNVTVTTLSARPYSDPLQILSKTIQSPVLYIRAGSLLSNAAFSWLKSATSAYATRTDVAAFALDTVQPQIRRVSSSRAPDHDPKTWMIAKSIPEPQTTSAVLYSLTPRLQAFVLADNPPHMAVLDTFKEWLNLRRSDWYHYPAGSGIDGTPLGMSALPSRNWTRANWNVWFSAFLDEYSLSVVYPNLDNGKRLVTHENMNITEWNKDIEVKNFKFPEDVARFDGRGKLITQKMFGKSTIEKITKLGLEQNGMISFTLVNKVFLDTAKSWLCNVDAGGFRPNGLLWAVTDVETDDEMKKVKNSNTILLDEVRGGKETGHEFGNPGYWRLMLERTALIGEILRKGIAVFAFETDAIWLANPQPYIDQLVSQEADIVGTINTKGEVSGNFFYLRPTLATRRLWDEITREFEKAYKKAGFERKKQDSWTYIQNDQSLLTNLVLRNESWRRSYPLSFLTLDMELFVDGRWYIPDQGYYTSERARHPVVINNNFIIGVKEKMERAKKWGHWFWDEEKKICMDETVRKAIKNGSLVR